jgi:hypothetical protein
LDFRYDTFCGLYCGACDVLIANKNDAVDALAQAWNLEPEQLRCCGCKSAVNAVYCVDCDIKRCAESKGVEYCFECGEYPCSRLVAFRNDEHSHHSVVLQNLGLVQSQGIEQWLEQQRDRWSCPNCGTEFSWYARTCAACGGELYSCEDEEKDIVE